MNTTAHHKSVSLDDLTIDKRVQRVEGADQVRINKMAESFNPLALGTITVWQRDDGKLVVLDGMHRCGAARQAGHSDLIDAIVITGITVQEAAELFLLLNATKTPSAITKFLVRVVQRETTAVQMSGIIAAHGWRVRPASGPGNLTAVTAIERVFRNAGGTVAEGEHADILDRTLDVVTAAWEHDQGAVDSHMLLAVAQLIGRFGGSIDTKKLVAEMQDTRPGVLVGRAKVLRDAQGGTVPAALAKILAGLHNKKRRTNLLPEWVWIR